MLFRSLFRVTHAYRDVYAYAKSLGSSGSCNINVACPQSAGWENEIRSVCMLVVGGSGFCTGALVNNTSNDGTPYILTANHCSASNDFASWVFWFNWQSATCTNPTSSPTHNQTTTSGSVLKARNSGSDFCLVQMNATPPVSFNVYYAGWDNTGALSTSQVCIHHPSADIKKITFDNQSPTAVDWGSPLAACWQIGSWDAGTTEPGSSGSPLFNNNHKIIGQLFGGSASCSSLTNDNFGRFAVSWNTGTTADTRLIDWLDKNNTGTSVLNGIDGSNVSVQNTLPPPTNGMIFPNPAHDILNVDLSFFDHKAELLIMNTLGQIVSSKSIEVSNQKIIEIPIHQLKPGFYILKVSDPYKTSSAKFFIEK